jgi:hypothetical protein
LPFTVSATADMASSSKSGQKASFFAPKGSADGGSGQNRVDLAIFCSCNGLRCLPARNAATGGKWLFARVSNLQGAAP